MVEIKGYITNLGKYNEGQLIGEYISFPIDEDELQEVFERIGINDEYEEFFFTDWDCDCDLSLGEYENIDEINELAEALDNWDEDLLKACLEVWSIDDIIDNDPDDYWLATDIEDDYDLGYYWAVESGCYTIDRNNPLSNYIDYESFGRDIRYESSGDHTSFGWIEYRG